MISLEGYSASPLVTLSLLAAWLPDGLRSQTVHVHSQGARAAGGMEARDELLLHALTCTPSRVSEDHSAAPCTHRLHLCALLLKDKQELSPACLK